VGVAVVDLLQTHNAGFSCWFSAADPRPALQRMAGETQFGGDETPANNPTWAVT
jgi:hypothetical protein